MGCAHRTNSISLAAAGGRERESRGMPNTSQGNLRSVSPEFPDRLGSSEWHVEPPLVSSLAPNGIPQSESDSRLNPYV